MALKLVKLSFLVILLYQPNQSISQVVYLGENYTGSFTNAASSCNEYNSIWNRKVSSIDPKGVCRRFYDDKDCIGNFIEISSRTPSAHKLADWNFNNIIRSNGPCTQLCPLQIFGVGEAFVTIFSQIDFKGSYHDISVKGCTQLPTEYHNHSKSILTNNYCIQLYKSESCDYESETDTIELRPGTPYHNDLSKARKSTVVKAISRCDYKCLNVSFVIPKEGDVVLFKNTNFTGNKHNFSIIHSYCTRIPTYWEGIAESIGLGNNTCVILFDRRRCIGRQLRINASVLNLSIENFSCQIRSIRSCFGHLSTTTSITTSSSEVLILATEITTEGTNVTRYYKYDRNKQPEISQFSELLIAVVVVVPLAAVILIAVVVVSLFKYCSPYKKGDGKLSEKEIREFLSGMGIDLLASGGGHNKKENEYSTEFLAQNNAYNMDYELARTSIEIDPGAILGSGEFGIVYKGKLAIRNEAENSPSTSTIEKTTVAIKTVNQTSGLNGIRSLLKEVKVMLYMGQHTNIAKLIGCCTDKIREGDIMVVMEYCSEGSLELYLKKNRTSFLNLVNKGNLELKNKTASEKTETDASTFDTMLIMEWGLEIARGMEFLSNAKVVHSDLAARNILLNENLVAKISDFGLSRQLYAYSQYMKKHQEPLPFRWMAIESLKCLEFSTKSDVWSYGVLLWEIFSLGEKPYPGLGWNEAFISNLESGLRLAKPKNSTNGLYNLMLRCWDENAGGRPSFMGIVEEIQEMKAGFQSSKMLTPFCNLQVIF